MSSTKISSRPRLINTTSSFLPTSITGCGLWLDGADPAGTGVQPAINSTVSTWKDKSGTVNDGTSGSATFNTDSVGAYINFTGSENYVITNPNIVVNQYFTVFVVETLQNYSGSDTAFMGGTGQNNNNLHLLYRGGDISFSFYGADMGATPSFAFSNNASQPTRIWTFSFIANLRSIYLNGNSIGSSANDTKLSGWGGARIGFYFDSGRNYRGKMREILIYSGTINTTNRQTIESYLANKWGLTSSLPAGHPGLTSVPNTITTTIAPITSTVTFSPTSIAGCQLWLDALDSSTVSGTTTVTQWRDKSGNARHLGAGSGTTSYSSNAIQVNNSYLYVESPVNLSSFTVFIVIKTTGGNNQTVFSGKPNPANTDEDWDSLDGFGFFMDSQSSVRFYGQFSNVSQFNVNTSTPQVFSFQSSGTSLSSWYNGVSKTGATLSSSRTSTAQGFMVGASWSGSSYYNIVATASVYEAITYNTILTTTQRQQVESYLAQKWSLTSNLPSGHPGLTTSVYQNTVTLAKQKLSNIPRTITTLSTFLPTSITGCRAWFDAADSTTLTLNGSNVTQWNDKSGNSNNATQSTTIRQPISGTITQNGLNVLNLTSKTMTYPTISLSAMSIFCVYRQLDFTGYRMPLSLGAFAFFYANGGTVGIGRLGVTDEVLANYSTYGITSNVYTIYSGTVSISGSTTTNMYFNGTNVASNTVNSSGGDVRYEIGRSELNSIGYIGEVLIYDSVLTTQQRQNVEGYLAQKWGLTASLASGHSGLTSALYGSITTIAPTTTIISASFVPTSITGCGIWLDATDLTTFTYSSGSNISQWRDKSGSSNHFGLSRGTATSTVDNGRNVVNFVDATVMTSANQISFTSSSAFFIVSKMTSTNSAQNLIGFYPGITNGFSLRFFSSVLYSGNSDDLSLGNYYVNGNFNPTYTSNAYYNTYSLISTTAPSRGGNSIISLSDNWILEGFAQRFFIGNIAEFLFYPAGMTSTQRQTVEGYLAQKWGLTSNLPSGHTGLTSTLFGTTIIILPKQKIRSIPPVIGYTRTFSYTGSNQTFVVPATTTSIRVYMWGAGGGGNTNYGGAGAMVQGILTTTPGETLNILVGQGGTIDGSTTFGGGGAGAGNMTSSAAGIGYSGNGFPANGGSGGGRSAIQRSGTDPTNDIIVAGGGGGGTFSFTGGYATFSGTANPGTGGLPGLGGTQSAGGAGGGTGQYGQGLGGSRGIGGNTYNNNIYNGGGGGGGGYYGGGAGGTNLGDGSGGGGGSSFTNNLSLISGQSVLGFNSTNGYTAPNTASSYYVSGVGNGAPAISSNPRAGGNGLVVIVYMV